MSGTQPPARALGVSTRTTWVRRHAKNAIIIAACGGVLAAAWLLPKMQPNEEVQPPPSAALLPDTYQPAPEPAIVRAAFQQKPPPVVSPTPVTAPALAEKPAPALVVTSFHRSNGQPPEYLKPRQVAAAASAVDPAVSGIAYKGEELDGTSAFLLKHASLVLPQFTTIPCILETGIITGVSGQNPFRCRLPQDVKSPEGVVLMEQGTVVGGYYQSLVAEGQERIVAVTANARTPNNIVVPLGGPVADEIGAAGAEGTVDNHWWRRIGPALLLSLLDVGAQLGSSALQSNNGSGNSTINVGGSLQGGPFSDVTRSLLESQLKIAPTITLKQGTVVNLWTTRWISFDHVYALESMR